MDTKEAETIIRLLKKGKKFGIRYKNDEWGINHISDDKFEKWTKNIGVFTNEKGVKDLCQNYIRKEMSEKELFELLFKYYDFDDIVSKLKD